MNWTKLVAVTGVTVLVFLGGANAASLQPSAEIVSACDVAAPPPALLETSSKYDQTDATRSAISFDAAQTRRVGAASDPRCGARTLHRGQQNSGDYACAVKTLASWAAANALGDMRSEDAFLSRDRLISET